MKISEYYIYNVFQITFYPLFFIPSCLKSKRLHFFLKNNPLHFFRLFFKHINISYTILIYQKLV